MKHMTVKPAYHPLNCGCVPYVDTQSYEGWHQFGFQVPKGVKGVKPIRISNNLPGRESLWCKCVVKAAAPRTQRATRDAGFVETDRIVAGPKVGYPAIERIHPAVVATSPTEVAVQSAPAVDRELYETALRVQQNTEAGLLNDMLAGPEAQPETVTVAAHPMTQGGSRVRTITNRAAEEHRTQQVNDPTPRAPRTRANTNEIGSAPQGAMPLAEMMAQLAE